MLTLFPFLGISKSFPGSFVRSSSTKSRSTTAETATGGSSIGHLGFAHRGTNFWPSPLFLLRSIAALPPWLRPHQDDDTLPHSLYPILPPPVPYITVQPIALSRSSSDTGTDYDTIMTDASYNEGEREVSTYTVPSIHGSLVLIDLKPDPLVSLHFSFRTHLLFCIYQDPNGVPLEVTNPSFSMMTSYPELRKASVSEYRRTRTTVLDSTMNLKKRLLPLSTQLKLFQ